MTMPAEILPLVETITPVDEAAVAEAVRDAYRTGTPVYPIGGGTGLDYGPRPSRRQKINAPRPGIGLSLANLNRVTDYPADDMTITVEAGLTIAELADRLAARGQRLPVDAAHARRATVGGLVATAPTGPRSYAYGTIRDYVIGIRAVDGLGSAFSGGGRVRNNAAGYNLGRLLAGSLGTLGVITQVTLTVRPLPETSALVIGEVPDLDAAERLLDRLVRTRTLPAAVDLLAGSAPQDSPVIGPMPRSSVARLVVGLEGSGVAVDWMVRQLQDEWHQQGVASVLTLREGEADPLWQWLIEFPAHVQVNVRPGAAVRMIGRLLQLDPDAAMQAHAGDGVVRAGFSPPVFDRFGELVRSRLRPAATAAGGKVTVLCGPIAADLTAHDVWGPPGDGATVMQALKDRFDPKGLLNPGRLLYPA